MILSNENPDQAIFLKQKLAMKTSFVPFTLVATLASIFSCQAQLMKGHDVNGDIPFKKTVLFSDFVSEGVAVGDVNNDGKIDVMAGPFLF